jgi:hypothetical protein
MGVPPGGVLIQRVMAQTICWFGGSTTPTVTISKAVFEKVLTLYATGWLIVGIRKGGEGVIFMFGYAACRAAAAGRSGIPRCTPTMSGNAIGSRTTFAVGAGFARSSAVMGAVRVPGLASLACPPERFDDAEGEEAVCA